MIKEFSCISEIREIRKKKSVLSERESELSRPTLTDYSLIPVIYKWFLQIMSSRQEEIGRQVVFDRLKFIFIILFLYAPGSLAGGKMPDGLRVSIASTLGEVSPCVISNNKKSASFFYNIYNRYREDIEFTYNKIMGRLNDFKADKEQIAHCFNKNNMLMNEKEKMNYLWDNY